VEDCWVEPVREAVRFVPDAQPGHAKDAYIDLLVHKGQSHLAYLNPVRELTPSMESDTGELGGRRCSVGG
jgi:hypothetical protein